MKIALSVGHSILKNGNITSADGLINEYKYCKEIAPIIAMYLKELGTEVTVIICPEKVFTVSTEEKSYKVDIINKGNFDLVVELHLNAFSADSANGTEVYYISESGKIVADRVQKKLSTVFVDRGIQKKDNLYILNQTNPSAILLELFFCTNQNDVAKGKNMDKLARLIAEGIVGKELISVPKLSAPTKTITRTSSKKDIKWLQEHLNIKLKDKWPMKANGIYCNNTRIAVLIYWELLGWNKDGSADGWRTGQSTIKKLSL